MNAFADHSRRAVNIVLAIRTSAKQFVTYKGLCALTGLTKEAARKAVFYAEQEGLVERLQVKGITVVKLTNAAYECFQKAGLK